MKSKKIAIYSGQLYMGGIERVLINYLEKLAKEPSLDITLVIKENIPEKNIFFKDIPKNIKVEFIKSEEFCRKHEKLSEGRKKNIITALRYQWNLFYSRVVVKKWIEKYFKENKFDKIIDFDGSMWKSIKNLKTPVIGWVHFTIRKNKKPKKLKKKFELYNKIVLICDDMKKELEEMFPEYKDKAIRIYNPMDFEAINKRINDEKELTEKDRELLKDKYFVAVSRLVAGKNRVALVEIYNELKKRGRKEKLYILGEGEDRVNIEKAIEKFNLKDDIILLGQKKNPFPFMKNAELFLHTSMGEGLPTVFIESMLCDTIVVAYDCPTGPREILMDGKAGGLVSLNNKKEFENKVIEILENKEIKDSIKENMKKKMHEFEYSFVREELFEILN